MTKREMFNHIATLNASDAEVVEFCNKEIERLDNRKSAPKGLTKTQKENEVIMEKMLESLAAIATPCTVTELLKHGIEGFDLSNQKASALLRNLIKDGKVVKAMEGKKALFSLA